MAKEDYQAWLKRSESNLCLAKRGKIKGVVYEDLCFEAQQAAEKALKALLIYFEETFPKVHSFDVLLERLQRHISLPKNVIKVLDLSDYAVQTRYPGDYYPVGRREYLKAIKIASDVVAWVNKIIAEKQKRMF